MKQFSMYNVLNKEYIVSLPIIENLNEEDNSQLETIKKEVTHANILLMTQLVPIFLVPIVLYFTLNREVFFLIPIVVICSFIPLFIFLRMRKKKKEKYDVAKMDFDLKKKEVYFTNTISSSFYESSEYSGSTYKVKLEGFTIDAIIHEKELPQLADSKFIIERLPTCGVIIKIKNTKVN